MPPEIYGFLIIIFALCGFSLSIYIHRTKKKGKSLVCPLDGACDFVTRSEYSIIFDIPVEELGVFYYATMALIYSLAIFGPASFYAPAIFVGAALSAAGFIMSIYFTWLQAAVMKKWCTLCATSAFLTVLIFSCAFLGFWPTVISFLSLCVALISR